MPCRVPALVTLAVVAMLVLSGCGGGTEAQVPGPLGTDDSGLPTPSQPAAPAPTIRADTPLAVGSADPSAGPPIELCERIETVQSRLAELSALELRPTARVTLDIELARVQAAFSDMRQDALSAPELDLTDPVRRLGYRLDDLALAVEDFRTTSRPRDAVSHVGEDAVAFADALAGFGLQAGC
jgi:hypothetical protein